MGDRHDLDDIRQRHAQWHDDSLAMDADEWVAYAHAVIEDRDVLLAEVDRLRAENIDLASSSAGWAKQVPRLLAEVDRLTAENAVLRTEIANITASKRAQP